MNEAMQNLLTRRAVRAYKADPVPKDVLERVGGLVRAGDGQGDAQQRLVVARICEQLALASGAALARVEHIGELCLGPVEHHRDQRVDRLAHGSSLPAHTMKRQPPCREARGCGGPWPGRTLGVSAEPSCPCPRGTGA